MMAAMAGKEKKARKPRAGNFPWCAETEDLMVQALEWAKGKGWMADSGFQHWDDIVERFKGSLSDHSESMKWANVEVNKSIMNTKLGTV
jgi:hypothetical protein